MESVHPLIWVLGVAGTLVAGGLYASGSSIIENRAAIQSVETRILGIEAARAALTGRFEHSRKQVGDMRERLASLEATCK